MFDALARDPLGAHKFRLLLDGPAGEVPVLQVSGLGCAAAVYEIEEGGLHGYTHQRPGPSRWEPLVVQYATGASRALDAWRDAFLRDPFHPGLSRSGTVLIVDADGSEVRSFQFIDAWPVRWTGPTLEGDSSRLAVEALELAHHGLFVKAAR